MKRDYRMSPLPSQDLCCISMYKRLRSQVQTFSGPSKKQRHIIETLETTGWRVSGKDGAAEILGINPKTLASRMQRLGIQREKKYI